MALRPVTSLFQCSIAAEAQAGQPGFACVDQLPINIQLVNGVSFATKEAVQRVRRLEAGNVEYADVHCRQQYAAAGRDLAIGITNLDAHRLVLTRPGAVRGFQFQLQCMAAAVQRQMQHAYGTFCRLFNAVHAGTSHQCGDIEVVTCPVFVDGDAHVQPVGRHIDVLPPERAVGRLHQHIAGTGMGCLDAYLGGFTVAVGGTVQLQANLIGPHSAIPAAVLPAIAGPETFAADQSGLWIFYFNAVGAPLYGELDVCRHLAVQTDLSLLLDQALFAVTGAPAGVGGITPVVIAAFADQAYLQIVSSLQLSCSVGQHQAEAGQGVFIDLVAIGVMAKDADQLRSWPDRLQMATGNRAAAGLHQADPGHQLQR